MKDEEKDLKTMRERKITYKTKKEIK